MKLIQKDEPTLIIGSSICTNFSTMMHGNWSRMTQEAKDKRMNEARQHLDFCINIYKVQHVDGRFFLYEHPLSATA